MKIRQIQVEATQNVVEPQTNQARTLHTRVIADLEEGDVIQEVTRQLQCEAEASLAAHVQHVRAQEVMKSAAISAAQTISDYEGMLAAGQFKDKPELASALDKASETLVRSLTTGEIADAYGHGSITRETYLRMLGHKAKQAKESGDMGDFRAITQVLEQAKKAAAEAARGVPRSVSGMGQVFGNPTIARPLGAGLAPPKSPYDPLGRQTILSDQLMAQLPAQAYHELVGHMQQTAMGVLDPRAMQDQKLHDMMHELAAKANVTIESLVKQVYDGLENQKQRNISYAEQIQARQREKNQRMSHLADALHYAVLPPTVWTSGGESGKSARLRDAQRWFNHATEEALPPKKKD